MARLALLGAVLLAAGCGGHRAPATDAAELVPADALAYVVVAPNALGRAQSALPRFGPPAAAIPYLRAGETARLRGGIVSFAQPADGKAFTARLRARGESFAKVRGWIVYAPTKALVDAVKRSKRSLAETARYRRGFATLPDGAAVRAYEPLRVGWRAEALTVGGGSSKLEVHTPAGPAPPPGSLAHEIPAAATVAISSFGGAVPPGARWVLDELSRLVGADVGSILTAARGPYVLYAAPGAPVPDVTFAAARSPTLAAAVRALAGTLAGGSVPKGTAALDLGPVTLYAGPVAGQLVLSDADDPSAELLGGTKLSGDGLFREAEHDAGLPPVNDGFTYVDARRTLRAVEALAGLANRPVPPAVERRLAPVRALLDWTGTSGGVRTVTYLRVS